MTEPEKFDPTSTNIADEQLAKLKSLFPEAITEGGKIDFDRLKLTLGESVDVGKERYGMNWPGKADCFKTIQRPSMATLVPAKDESVNFDTTENLFIEGDNLETLKLLQRSYLGKVKMIYIDPPYNTGNDFIYPDDYSESLETYLRYTGQVDNEGRKFSTNTETDGRFHSKWMNMIYPRLFLARNLLRDDGLIFVSINDKEQSNLKSICNDIYGEENFLAQLIWDKNHSAQAGVFKVYHEYVLVYAKNIQQIHPPKSANSDEFDAGAMKKESERHPMQKFKFPKGTRFDAPHGTELSDEWGDAEKVYLHEGRMISEHGKLKEDVVLEAAFTQANQMKQFFYGDRDNLLDSRGQKITCFYFTGSGKIKVTKERAVITPPTVGRWGTQGEISVTLAELFKLAAAPLETPKSPAMIREFIEWFCDEGDIVLDYFAGSCATAQAVLDSEITRKFIMVQLPERSSEGSEALKAGYKTIADLGKERIRRVIKSLVGKKDGKLNFENNSRRDLGFKVFKLQSSNFKAWNAEQPKDDAVLAKQLSLHVDHLVAGRTQEDVLYELLLKSGFPLDTKVQKVSMAGKSVFSVADGMMLICLEKELTSEVIKAMADTKPERVVCLDAGFSDNDQLKTNAVQTMKSKGVTKFQTV